MNTTATTKRVKSTREGGFMIEVTEDAGRGYEIGIHDNGCYRDKPFYVSRHSARVLSLLLLEFLTEPQSSTDEGSRR